MNLQASRLGFRKPLLLISALVGTAALAAPPLPVIPSATYNVTSYGAKGDGSTNNTAAIQDAINAAKTTGGTVVFPASSGVYLCGPIHASSFKLGLGIQINSGVTLRAEPYGTFTPASTDFISISEDTNVEISGSGTIDGQGGSGWWTTGESGTRPQLLHIEKGNTVELAGVTVENSPKEHIVLDESNDVTITGVTVTAASSSANTDGIDPAGTNYLIENCNISDGDDNIAIKAADVACSAMTVTNCTFGAGHGLSVGGQTNSGLSGLTVNSCQFNGTQYGLRLKADRGSGGVVTNCTYSNITMSGVEYPVYICSYYGDYNPVNTSSTRNPPIPDTSKSYTSGKTPVWTNITFSAITSTDTTAGSYAGLIWGLPEELVSNVVFNDVKLTSYFGMAVNYATGIDFINGCTMTVSSGTAFANPLSTQSATTCPNDYDASLENAP